MWTCPVESRLSEAKVVSQISPEGRWSLAHVNQRMQYGTLLWTAVLVAAGLAAFGCVAPTANLVVSAPTDAVVGTAFSVTVSAKVRGNPDTVFNSPIHFTSSDKLAVLPPDYQFTSTDAGSHTFANGITLMTPGSQSVTATDVETSFLTATAEVMVSSSDTR
jgi:hypothetical protein